MSERFDDYVERCLYHPEHGFYTAGVGVAGRRRGDFLTSPEVGPLFGDVIGRYLDRVWAELGRPDPFVVHDVGTGPGTLARRLAVVDGPSAEARTVRSFDRADGATAPAVRQAPSALASAASLPDDLAGSVVIANEVLDNIAFRIVEYAAGTWHEVHVAPQSGSESALVEVRRPVDHPDKPVGAVVVANLTADLTTAGIDVVDGLRVPILERARNWLTEVLAQQPAVVLAFDYGAPTTAELVARGGWLRTYRQHKRGNDPLREPGHWDITTDVAFDQLPPPIELTDQATFLRRWGIDDLVAEGRRYWQLHAAQPDLKAFMMRSRVSESEALLDPSSLGRWLVAEWHRPDLMIDPGSMAGGAR